MDSRIFPFPESSQALDIVRFMPTTFKVAITGKNDSQGDDNVEIVLKEFGKL